MGGIYAHTLSLSLSSLFLSLSLSTPFCLERQTSTTIISLLYIIWLIIWIIKRFIQYNPKISSLQLLPVQHP